MKKDLTRGAPAAVILRFTVPVILGNLFQQLYTMVDTVVVGQCLGTNALAAVLSALAAQPLPQRA